MGDSRGEKDRREQKPIDAMVWAFAFGTAVFILLFFFGIPGPKAEEHRLHDSFYWTLSALAQTIAAFVAFLLAGYALLHTHISNQQLTENSTDEGLPELLNDTARNDRKFLAFLLRCVAAVISLALLLLAFGEHLHWRVVWFLLIVTLWLSSVAVWGSVSLVVRMIDPDRIKNFANELTRPSATSPTISRGTYVDRFIDAESFIREFIKDYGAALDFDSRSGRISMKIMLDVLHSRGVINAELYTDFFSANSFRNNVAHGTLKQVETRRLEEIQSLDDRMRKSIDEWIRKRNSTNS